MLSCYNADEELYEFDIDYAKFPRCTYAYRKKWTVCSNSERISTFRNPAKNSSWDYKTVILTEEFNRLFEEYGINKGSELKSQMLDCAQKNGSAFCKEFVKLLALCLQLRNSMSDKEADIDYLISPVKNSEDKFYDSREYDRDGAVLPRDADANGAYNIARKALWAVNNLKRTDDEQLKKADISVKNAEWLEFAQR